jgi:hypothetical protein
VFGPLSAHDVLGAFLMSDLVLSWARALIFQANHHVVGEVEWPLPDHNNNAMQVDWAHMQVETTQDYAHGSWLQTVCTISSQT